MAASPTRCKVNLDWIDSEIFENEDPAPLLEHVHGILVPGGFGERGTEGKIQAAHFARERHVPYFGICFGMQMAVIEAARNLGGIAEASSTEFGPTPEPVVGLMTEWMQGNELEKRARRRRPRRHHAARRLSGDADARQPGRRYLRRDRDLRAPPPPLRGQHRLQGTARAARHALLRHVARRAAAEIVEMPRPSLVHRRAVPPGAEIPALRAASAVCVFIEAAVEQSRLV